MECKKRAKENMKRSQNYFREETHKMGTPELHKTEKKWRNACKKRENGRKVFRIIKD